MQSDYSSLVARRYKQYKREQRKKSLKNSIVSFLFKLIGAIVRVLQKARIVKRKVETVRVEEG